MDVLSLIHGENVRSGTFRRVVEERGHRLDEWSLAAGTPPPQPLDAYGAVLVFGGAMHADQDDRHPWLREENLFLQRLLAQRIPTLGICLGAQLLAKAAHAPVRPAPEPEIGWVEVELTEAAADDPLFSRLPERFDAFQWHYYTYGVPAGGDELARSRVCTQAFRLGSAAWGVQFHPEVSRAEIDRWLADDELASEIPQDAIARDTPERIDGWVDLGRTLCDSFLEVAERVPATV